MKPDPVQVWQSGSQTGLCQGQSSGVIQVLDIYLKELEEGGTPNRDELLARHPEIADQLRAYMNQLDVLHHAAAGLRDPAQTPSKALATLLPGRSRLGDFQIVGEVGRGGMGIVYQAEQISLRRRVALKVLPMAAALDGKQLQRFKHEAEAAAKLQHPNIVPVYAVGCEEGVHYYAMQFIDGQTLAALIAQMQQLNGRDQKGIGPRTLYSSATAPASPEPWLPGHGPETDDLPSAPLTPPPASREVPSADTAVPAADVTQSATTANATYFRTVANLGIQAAEALEHAHQLGVVHRDIKPANLLLDLRGSLWLTDFGLARFHGNAGLSMSGHLLGTLRYMSPEQASAKRGLIDQRTDIYSLAVTLYELLTLEPAFRDSDPQELLRQIASDEPCRPRRLNRAIPLDLETIVLKGMAKSPEERYGTAQDLADDLRRFLEDKPVQARRPSTAQRLWKWARRHKSWVAAGVAALVLAVVALAVTTGLVWTAQHQEAEQRKEAVEQRKVAEQNLQLSYEALEDLLSVTEMVAEQSTLDARSQQEVQKLLQKVLRSYEQFAQTNEANPAAQYQKARAYRRLGDVHQRLVQHVEAGDAYGKAIVLLKDVVTKNPTHAEYGEELATAYRNLARLQRIIGQSHKTEETLGQALTLLKKLVNDYPKEPEYSKSLANGYHELGVTLHATGRSREAIAAHRQALALLDPLADRCRDDALYQHARASSLQDLGQALFATGQFPEAEKSYRQALALRTQLDFGNNREFRFQRAAVHNNLGQLLLLTQHLQESEAEQRQSIAILQVLAQECPSIPNFRKDLAGAYTNLGSLLNATRRLPDAEKAYGQALSLLEVLVRDFPRIAEYRRILATALNNQAVLLLECDRPREAEQAYRRALALVAEIAEAEPNMPDHQQAWAGALNNLAILLRDQGKAEMALPLVEQALSHQEKALKLNPHQPQGQAYRLSFYRLRADILLRLGKHDEAAQVAEQLMQLIPNSWENALSAAKILGRCGTNLERARELLQLAIQTSADNPDAQNQLAWFLAHPSNPLLREAEQAVQLAKQAVERGRGNGAYWNTLGAAYYRAGNWPEAIKALNKSMELHQGSDSFDLFFLAIAHWQQGEKDQAREFYDRAVEYMQKNEPKNEELKKLQAEAELLIGHEKHEKTQEKEERNGPSTLSSRPALVR